jgi:hypothetical protein
MLPSLIGIANTGKQPLGPEAATALAGKWILYDWLRTALIAVGFVASIKAISSWAVHAYYRAKKHMAMTSDD